MDFVFIIGLPRTGSKIYATNINRFSDIDLVSEMHYYAPFFIRKDFVSAAKGHVGRTPDENTDKLIEFMYNGGNGANFWKTAPKEGSWLKTIGQITKNDLKKRLSEYRVHTWEELFRVLLEEHAFAVGKTRGGAKTPFDIGYTRKLMGLFPDAKFLHITRDPRAIYASMVKGDLNRSVRKDFLKRFYIRLTRMLYLIIQYKRSARIHKTNRDNINYYLSRFEDVITDPRGSLHRICDFMETKFFEEMLAPPIIDSNIRAQSKGFGIDKSALYSWKSHLSIFEERLITLILSRDIKILNGKGERK